ncbi:hypothetical protein PSH97_13040 [Pseudomonas cucumis]|uniref:Shikimate dehydrogenase substrate binding N-terminal domain-containing protein n=1 Tax=Pseudomonas cucumis TaxID=2954082 RepID=A0ABY9F5N3_9PSED|nr:hypothetical protein [Pseudomonas cucumis]WLG87387.1 hypothetical protein PSH97_13040 [Pseudomonas cucumis]
MITVVEVDFSESKDPKLSQLACRIPRFFNKDFKSIVEVNRYLRFISRRLRYKSIKMFGEHIKEFGYPIEGFKAPMIYNPYFEAVGIDARVMPMGVRAKDYPTVLPALFRLTNVLGALVTMPHKITTASLVDELSPTAAIAGSCNAILLRPDGSLLGDMFDGEGFVRGALRKGCVIRGARALVIGSGGVGSAIAASLAAAGVAALSLFDERPVAAEQLGARLKRHYPTLDVQVGTRDPAGFEIVVNATPLGVKEGDPLPMDVS